ncbi:hypothetical protein AVEN_259529-1 [Araneus ventricosus]|uniref:Uncharacterized protein n=1 Tax=Araneus ventricosus TaxID=182803 RepID=A0A4Y2NKZ4_ARAVE|nr:hypothetical protein AVEN_259529-1 [Araneus ventricosus]
MTTQTGRVQFMWLPPKSPGFKVDRRKGRLGIKEIKYQDKSKGLPKNVNIGKLLYIKFYDRKLLKLCLDAKTQNPNEFSGLIWKYIPKEAFVELKTLKLGVNMAVIQFNKCFSRFKALLAESNMSVGKKKLLLGVLFLIRSV